MCSMTRRRITVKGQGQDARVTFYVEVYRGKVWITSFDCPFTAEAILEPAQADSGSSHLVGFCSQVITESGCLVDTGSDCFRRPVRVAA